MGKKINAKLTTQKESKKRNIKKANVPHKKQQQKESPKKKVSNKKNGQTLSNKIQSNATMNINNKMSSKQSNKTQPSKKKQTKKCSKKDQKLSQIQKSFGSKKMNKQMKKEYKKQRLSKIELNKKNQQQQNINKISIQNSLEPQYAIYRKQIPQSWKESIIRYHEAKMTQNEFQIHVYPSFSSSLQQNHDSNSVHENKHSKKLKVKQKKQQKSKGVKKPITLKNSKTIPQIIEISSSHNSQSERNNYVSFNFHETLYSDSSKLESSNKKSNKEESLPIKNGKNNIISKYQVQKDNDQSVSQNKSGNFSKSQSKSSYEYEVMSLSQSKENSVKSRVHNHKGKNPSKLTQHDVMLSDQTPGQSSSISSHSISPEYNVEKIVSSKIKGGKTLYEIKWAGYPDQQNTLEPLKNLKNIMEMVVEFQKRQKQSYKQTLKQNQKLVAEKNKQIASKNRQLATKTKKLDFLKDKVEELTRKLKDLQKQKNQMEKIQQTNKIEQSQNRLKNQWDIKPSISDENYQKKQYNFTLEKSYKIKIFKQESEKDKITISTQSASPILNQDELEKLQIHSLNIQQVKKQFTNLLNMQQISENQNISNQSVLNQEMIEQQKDEIAPLYNDTLIRIDDFDKGNIHSDLQMVEYSFPFFATENNDKNDKNSKYYQTDLNFTNENNLQNHKLLEEYDCLKYLSSNQ